MAEPLRVAVRVRPFSPREVPESGGRTPAVTVEGQEVSVRGTEETFHFTHCFWSCDEPCGTEPFASQEAVFSRFGQALMADAVSGYNGAMLAYGQTGSGKSYTVRGVVKQPGLIPRCVADLFTRKTELEKRSSRELRVWISYMEIYNDHVRDLIWPGVEALQEEPRILDHPRLGVCVPQLTEAVCQTPEDVQTVFDFGTKRRVTAATHMNERSSRSHTVFTLRLEVLNGEQSLSSRVHLVDLAGSERQARFGNESLQVRESCSINLSLSSLALVVRELNDAAQQPHHGRSLRPLAAFRTSKLTLLLKDALVGNCRTYMIATVSPSTDCMEETAATLRFASSMGKLRTAPVQNRGKREEQVDQLHQEIRRLRGEMAEVSEECLALGSTTANLTELELLLMSANRGYEKQLENTRELNRVRQASLWSHGLSQDRSGEMSSLDNSIPFMTNMSDDPMVAGCLIYHLPGDALTTIGAADGNSIMLRGIGISDHLCRITNRGNLELSIQKLSSAGRVCVNGKILHESEVKELNDGDKVYIGRAYALKVTVPLESARQSPGPTARRPSNAREHGLLLQGLEDEWSAIHDSHSWRGLQDYLEQVLAQMQPEHAKRLHEEMKLGCKICDEANDITAECKPDENLHFEVDLTSSVPSSVVLRVLQADNPNMEPEQWTYSTLYLWSLTQMSERLERMRDYHEAIMRDGIVEIDPILDPWHEPHPGTVALRLRELEMLAQVQLEHAEAVRLKNWFSMSRRFTLSDRGRVDVARCVFGAWAAMARERKASGRFTARRGRNSPRVNSRGDSGSWGRGSPPRTTVKSFKTGVAPPRAAPPRAAPERLVPAQLTDDRSLRRSAVLGGAAATSRRGPTGAKPRPNSGFAAAATVSASSQPALSLNGLSKEGLSQPALDALVAILPEAQMLPCTQSTPDDQVCGLNQVTAADRDREDSILSLVSDKSARTAADMIAATNSYPPSVRGPDAEIECLMNGNLRTPCQSPPAGGAKEADAQLPGFVSENEMLRRQLDAALQLCTVLKTKVNHQDLRALEAEAQLDGQARGGGSPRSFEFARSTSGLSRSPQRVLQSGSVTSRFASMGIASASVDVLTQSQTSVPSSHYTASMYTGGAQTPRAASPLQRVGSPMTRHRVNSVVHRMTSAPDNVSRMRSCSPDVERYRLTGTPGAPHSGFSAAISGSTTPAARYTQEAIYLPASSMRDALPTGGASNVATPASPMATRLQVSPQASAVRVGQMERVGPVERFYSAPSSGPPVPNLRLSAAVPGGLRVNI